MEWGNDGLLIHLNTTKMKTIFKDHLLNSFANELLNNGFRLLVPVEPSTYCHYEKGGNLGYCQRDYFGGLTFSTVHKPSKENGTGFRVSDATYEPTIKDAESAFRVAPFLANSKGILKYTSFDDYLKYPTNQIIKCEIIEPFKP